MCRTKNMTKSLAIMQGFFDNTKGRIKMSDILQEAAKAYHQLLGSEYTCVFGDRKRNKLFSIITNSKETFTHVCGLDHIKDKLIVIGKNAAQKTAIFRKILNKEISFSDIENSEYLYQNMSQKNNPVTNKPYNIYDRILHICDLEEILDNSCVSNGKLYKWTKKAVFGKNTKINADYVFVVPSANKGENHYFFMNIVNRNDVFFSEKENDVPIKLQVISAFADSADFIMGLGSRYTLLEITKIDLATHLPIFTKTLKNYQTEKSKQSDEITSNHQPYTDDLKDKITTFSLISGQNKNIHNLQSQGGSAVLPISNPQPSFEEMIRNITAQLYEVNQKISDFLSASFRSLPQRQPVQTRTAYEKKVNDDLPSFSVKPQKRPSLLAALKSAKPIADEHNHAHSPKDKAKDKSQSL